jgi:hypothetical protein
MLANPIPSVNVVRVSILSEPRSFGLLRREEAMLSFCDFVEPLRGFLSTIFHNTILQLI